MTAGLMQDLQASIDKASAKGARDIVIISPEQAFIFAECSKSIGDYCDDNRRNEGKCIYKHRWRCDFIKS